MIDKNFKEYLGKIIETKEDYKTHLIEKEERFNLLKQGIDSTYKPYNPKDSDEFELKLLKLFNDYKEKRCGQIKNNDFEVYDDVTEENIERVLRNMVVGTYFNLEYIDLNKEYSDENLFKAYLKYAQKSTTIYFSYFKLRQILGTEASIEELELIEKCYQTNISILVKMYGYIVNSYNINSNEKNIIINSLSTSNKNPLLYKICEVEDIDYLLKYISKRQYSQLKREKMSEYEYFTNINNQDEFEDSKESDERYLRGLTIAQYLDKNPIDDYPEARKMHRHFIIHSGPTNSGKTYQALEDLKSAYSGVYLGPLRLLAIEIQEKLLSKGVKCDLITGEEEMLIGDATHTASTIEKTSYSANYDVAVIDECQMIGDRDRGGSWTKAILGIKSNIIHLCTAPSAVNLLIKLIKMCGDTYEVVTHTRNTKLLIDERPFKGFEDCEKGDALVVFSKKNVLAVASALLSRGIKCSVIYGALPYKARKIQMEKFLNGETDIIVATDAIGLGLNAPIKRVVFIHTYKFDGHKKRKLHPEEVRQIAGRAGRFGMYDVGYVNAIENLDEIEAKLNSSYWDVEKAKLTLPESIIEVEGDLSENIKLWSEIESIEDFEKPNVSRVLLVLSNLKNLGYSDIGNYYSYKLATMYFEEDNEYVFKLWSKYLNDYFRELKDELEKPRIEDYPDDLYGLESYNKSLELYYAFSKSFSLPIDSVWLSKERLNISQEINSILIEEIKKHRKTCKTCGTELKWDSLETICVKCALKDAMQNTLNSGIRITTRKTHKKGA
ncbi:MAG: hypothetical protein IJ086_15310 [Clostridium sp.]|nr:hypothetical protein [Clostridium sp.]MBQ9000044.1 hypothetical protein [Clostridium sp.]